MSAPGSIAHLGASRRHAMPAPSAVLTLLKPITWFAPMWAFGCGLVSSGRPIGAHLFTAAVGVLLAGPLLCGTSQAVNDWFDRHVDAINEPNRPIPSGRIPGRWGLGLAIGWSLLSFAVALALGPWVSVAATLGLMLAWAYSAPPVRLKQNGWWGNLAVGVTYEGMAWFAGAAVLQAAMPDARIIATALLYSIGTHGIMTLNDFKSIEGDRQMGIASLPAQLGPQQACRLACAVMTVPQLAMIALLWHWRLPLYAASIGALVLAQAALMARLLASPRERAPWYNATGTSLYVIGMLVAAFGLRP